MKTDGINPQLRAHRAQLAFERNVSQLRYALRSGAPGPHLIPLVELLESLLPECGASKLTECYRSELRAVKALVAQRPNVRLQPRSHLRLIK